MALLHETNPTVADEFRLHPEDVGSTGVQIAQLSLRISHLTAHLGQNPKDFATRRGLQKMVGARRRLMNYYRQKQSAEAYKKLLATLGLRK